MRILFNSRNTAYKTPFGTLRRGERCILRLEIPENCGAVGAKLMLEDCDGAAAGEFPFEKEPACGRSGYAAYRCVFAPKANGLYFYWFYVNKKEGGFRLFRQGSDTNMEAGDKWQLSVIPEDFTVPDYARGAVMYQIFPDRFFRSGACDLTAKLRPFSLHERWEDTPRYTADEAGNWCSDFFGGNLRGICEKLPYLKELGVKILYFNPIFMAFSNHRYDTADYKRVDPMLGNEEDFRSLCAQAHRMGMRVVLDGVFSHTGSNSVYFDAKHLFGNGAASDPNSPYRSWYRFRRYPDDYDAWWNTPTLPNVEELEPSYVNYVIEDDDSVLARWLGLGADGFRLDVVDELPDEFVARLKRRLRALKPDALLIGEVWEDASNKRAYGVSRRYFVNGELDSVMNYPWRKAIIDFALGNDDGSALGECIMTLAENYPPQVLHCVMNLLGSHDTARILTVLGDGGFVGSKAEKAERFLTAPQRAEAVGRLRLASFLQFTLPGAPCIYYGDEAGVEGFEDPFCRRTYPWGREDKDLLSWYHTLTALRNGMEALKCGDVRVTEAGGGRLAFTRSTARERVEIYVNQTAQRWQLPTADELCFASGADFDGVRWSLEPNGFALTKSAEPA